ncbi:MAG: hypothetical protein U0412_09450 [Nitrospira sp.]
MNMAWQMSLVAGIVAGSVLVVSSASIEARPLDIPSERLERPRPEQDRLPESTPRLTQSEVIALAKKAAKKELGKTFSDYDVKSVLYEPSASLWSVTFELAPPRRPSDGCLLVLVHDPDRSTEARRCS